MATNQSATAIGQAWIAFRNGELEKAANAFEDVISRDGDNVDALYGLGLVRRSQSSRGTAIEKFKRCQALIAVEAARANTDRLTILVRMVEQRLLELQGGPA